MRIGTLAGTIVAFAAAMPLAAAAAPDEQPLPGVWQKHEYTLSYAGFTSHYSCDGIADKVRLLLLAAGARDDLKVRGSCSDPLGAPSRISIARATFHTLAPEAAAAAPPAGAAAEPVVRAPGVWKAVEFKHLEPNWLEAGDCELVEQFDRELLPLFTTRNRQSRMTCVPHQHQLGSIALRFEVFAAVPKPRSAAATP
jgi:hypothetical protein